MGKEGGEKAGTGNNPCRHFGGQSICYHKRVEGTWGTKLYPDAMGVAERLAKIKVI